jgi:ADP-ribose pyrophosphatase YjhB (NUDIX family)
MKQSEQKDLLLDNVLIASGPVIIENEKVLLNQHGEKKEWKFPGGDIYEKLGTFEEWAIRRAKEEMGLDCEIVRPLKPMILWNEDKTIILIHYLARRTTDKIEPAKFIDAWDWVDIKNLPENCAPNIKPVIEEYLKAK